MSESASGGVGKPDGKAGVTLAPFDPASAPTGAPSGFHPIAPLSAIPFGLSRAALPDAGGPFVVVRTADTLHVMDGLCAHAKGELHLGDVEELGGRLCVTCPRHRKKFPGGLSFDCVTGAARVKAEPLPEAKYNPEWAVRSFDSAVVAGWLFFGNKQ